MSKEKMKTKQKPIKNMPMLQILRRPVKRAGGESPLTIRTPTCVKDVNSSPAMKPRGQSQAVLFHRKGNRHS